VPHRRFAATEHVLPAVRCKLRLRQNDRILGSPATSGRAGVVTMVSIRLESACDTVYRVDQAPTARSSDEQINHLKSIAADRGWTVS
jgi:hypothetical protein